jgi:hypothetical protein
MGEPRFVCRAGVADALKGPRREYAVHQSAVAVASDGRRGGLFHVEGDQVFRSARGCSPTSIFSGSVNSLARLLVKDVTSAFAFLS